jgi:branched-chain amino acid transport system substrate-binding protein
MKQMIKRSMKLVAGVGAALSMVFSAPAVSQEIVWSAHLGLTGGSAYAAKFQLDGFSDFAAWKNAQGGIRGRKIKLLSEDTTFTVPVAIAGFKRLMAEHPEVVFVSGDSTGFVQGTSPENNERFKKLMTSGSFASEFVDTKKYPLNFLAGPSYGDMVGVLLKFIKDDWKGAGAPKLAIVHSSIEFGRDPIEGSVKRAKEMGIDVTLVEQTKFAEVDVGPIALKLRQANPDYTIVHGYAYATWPEVVKLAKDYGMKSKFLATIWSSDAPALEKLGPSVNGMIVVTPYPYITTGATAPMLKAIDEMIRKRDPKYDGYPTHGYMQSWLNAMLSAKAAEMVIDAKKPLTGPNMAAALEGLKNWDTGGMLGTLVDIKDHKMAVGRVWQVDMKQGQPIKMVPISAVIKL